MVFSVFIHPVLFSHSTTSTYLDQKPKAWGAGWEEQSRGLRPHPARVCRAPAPTQQLWSVGLAPDHLLALPGVGTAGQGSLGGFLSR